MRRSLRDVLSAAATAAVNRMPPRFAEHLGHDSAVVRRLRPLSAAGREGRRLIRRFLPSRGSVVWRRMRPLLHGRAGLVTALAAASLLVGLMEAGVLTLLAQVAAAMVAGSPRLQSDIGRLHLEVALGSALAIAFVLALVRMGLQVVVAWLPARVAADAQAGLRRDIFAAYTQASWRVQAGERDGHLQELMTSQIDQAVLAVLNVALLMSGGAMFLTLVVSAFALSPSVALVALFGAWGMFLVLRPVSRLGRNAGAELSHAQMNHAAAVNEAVRLSEESHVFGTAAAQRERVGGLVEAARRAFFRFQLAGGLSRTTYQSLAIVLVVGGLAALYLTDAGDLGALGAVVLMLVRSGTYGQQAQAAYHGINQMLPYLDRLENALERYRSEAQPEGGRPLHEIRSLAFAGVCFAYRPARPVLRDLSFEITAGEVIGIVGPSGAGKSTVVQLLLRLRPPDTGLFLVNGEPAETFSLADWHRRVSYVPQEPRVFDGTVAENIRYFRPLDDAAVERAARLAHIHDEIVAMPAGYDTKIGQRADAVSGGQRQRICLARALAGQPDMLVLDEPTSALDFASEAAVQASLSELRGKVTMVIVAHRPSLLTICDKVLVLPEGRYQAAPSEDDVVVVGELSDGSGAPRSMEGAEHAGTGDPNRAAGSDPRGESR